MSEGSSKKIKYCKANWRMILVGLGTLCDSLDFCAMVLTAHSSSLLCICTPPDLVGKTDDPNHIHSMLTQK